MGQSHRPSFHAYRQFTQPDPANRPDLFRSDMSASTPIGWGRLIIVAPISLFVPASGTTPAGETDALAAIERFTVKNRDVLAGGTLINGVQSAMPVEAFKPYSVYNVPIWFGMQPGDPSRLDITGSPPAVPTTVFIKAGIFLLDGDLKTGPREYINPGRAGWGAR